MKDLIIAVSKLSTAITGYYNPRAYESRVLRGLVGTGDKLAQNINKFMNELDDGNVSRKTLKRLDHFIRKWQSDRLKLR